MWLGPWAGACVLQPWDDCCPSDYPFAIFFYFSLSLFSTNTHTTFSDRIFPSHLDARHGDTENFYKTGGFTDGT